MWFEIVLVTGIVATGNQKFTRNSDSSATHEIQQHVYMNTNKFIAT